jgi:glucose-1-phosphate adenylyltransferase
VKDVTAVILGGGRGTRLYPLTLERAKPAVGLAGKYRLIDVPVSNCINSGLKRIYVITQFLSTSLHRHIMQTYTFDVFSDGFVEILAAEQTPDSQSWFQGTADAVRATLRHITYYKSDATLILSGDHLYRMDYSKLLAYHFENGADITLAVYPVPLADAPRMGLLRANETGEVTEFAEKPKDPSVISNFKAPSELLTSCGLKPDDDRYLASMGIYVFNPKVLIKSLADGEHIDFGKGIIPAAINNHRVFAYPFSGYWEDIGTIKTFFNANINLAQENPEFSLYEPGWPIYTRTRSLPPSRIIGSEIKDSLIVEGSDIHGASIQDSIIGVRSIVNPGAVLKDVVMNGSDYYEGEEFLESLEEPLNGITRLGIGENTHIEHCIIDKNARIGRNVNITRKSEDIHLEHDLYWIRDGITIIRRGAVIPDGMKI